MDLLIQRWRHLHSILNKWKVLCEKIPENEVYASLQTAATQIDAVCASVPNNKLLEDGGKTIFIKNVFHLRTQRHSNHWTILSS